MELSFLHFGQEMELLVAYLCVTVISVEAQIWTGNLVIEWQTVLMVFFFVHPPFSVFWKFCSCFIKSRTDCHWHPPAVTEAASMFIRSLCVLLFLLLFLVPPDPCSYQLDFWISALCLRSHLLRFHSLPPITGRLNTPEILIGSVSFRTLHTMVLLIIDEEYSGFLLVNLSTQCSSIQKQEMIVFCTEPHVGVSQTPQHLENCETFPII